MHREFRQLLNKATGFSQFVIVGNVDIRDFSAFSKLVESTDVAMYVKRVYSKLIDKYFKEASFFKPTGDGLIVIIPYTEQNLSKIVNKMVRNCFKAINDFEKICKNDPMINFEVPKDIGIGLARGSACCLSSNDKVLDYSGRTLNLASRLMDLARPSGLILSKDLHSLLTPAPKKFFKKERVFLKGVAEREGLDIYYSKNYTKIPEEYKHPTNQINWETLNHEMTLKEIKKANNFMFNLPSKVLDRSRLGVSIWHPTVFNKKREQNTVHYFDFEDFEYKERAGKPSIILNFLKLAKMLMDQNVKDNWDVKLEIYYPKHQPSNKLAIAKKAELN